VVLIALTPAYNIVQSPTVLLTIPVAFVLGLCIGGFAMCFTAVAPAISFLGYLFNIAILPMFWLSGTFFPIERLPGWLQTLAWFMPLTQVISINRHLINGTPEWQDLLHLSVLGGEAVVFGCIAAALVRRRLIK
jgi:lipooligosaccharide transport system permease protein